MSFFGSDAVGAGARAQALIVENSFLKSRFWELEKALGHGSYGVVLLIRDRFRGLPLKRRRVVLKVPIGDERGHRDLIHEIRILRIFRRCSHIGQMLANSEDVADANRPKRSFKSIMSETLQILRGRLRPPVDTVFDALRQSRIKGPAMLLEYLENGSLLALYMKAQGRVGRLPNRLLWRFYYCLIRGCIGLAYPPGGEQSDLEIETIRENMAPSRLRHGDIAMRNIMIGDRDPDGAPEHHLVEQLKLIDFGMMSLSRTPEDAISDNISAASEVMLQLINVSRHLGPPVPFTEYNGTFTKATMIIPRGGTDPFPRLDPELRDLIALGMALQPHEVPSLSVMLREIEQGMAKPASAYGALEDFESDGAIRRIMQILALDA
ncbi:hypothetical protein F5Y10DRAFT_265816 [Nemania abortiva]|nr:hypothetical protein F5Y10DRAFT_265816 [Nemania abortiva]